MFQRLPRHLQKDPLLRIHQLRFPRAVSEKSRVEPLDPFQFSSRTHIPLRPYCLLFHPFCTQLFLAIKPDQFLSSPQLLPQLLHIPRPGKSPRHPNNRYVLRMPCRDPSSRGFERLCHSRPQLAFPADIRRERGNGGIAKQVRHRQLSRPSPAKLPLHLQQRQRISSQIKKVLLHAYSSYTQNLLPYLRDHPLHFVPPSTPSSLFLPPLLLFLPL